MDFFKDRFSSLVDQPKTWLVTGVAGFIGSNLLEQLLKLDQKVVGLDNFSTGFQLNLDLVKKEIGEEKFDSNFRFVNGDICELRDCQEACDGIDIVLHQAAVGSVPKSIEDPLRTHRNNVDGFANMLVAAKDSSVSRFVFASSSSVYGDSKLLPQQEDNLGNLLSPYAASKRTNELYAQAYSKVYNLEIAGLRYFNVFGPRQNPNGAYAAVIPRWIATMLANQDCTINGDGSIYRDFTYVDNVVLANVLAGTVSLPKFEVFNVALGGQITLNELFESLAKSVNNLSAYNRPAVHGPNRKGDILTSCANIDKIKNILGFKEVVPFDTGIEQTVGWFAQNPSA